MIGKPVEYDLLKKKIAADDIEYAKSLFDISKYNLSYLDKLHKKEKFLKKETFENMRYYLLHINRLLYKLDIPYINMIYYKRKNEEIPSNQKLARLIEACCYEELYFYYFFEVIDSVFNIINKLLVLVNATFELNLDNKANNEFEINIVKTIKSNFNLYNIQEVKSLVDYLKNYKGSIYEHCKEDYRNLVVHDFTNEIPKYEIIDGNIVFGDNLRKDKSYSDCIKLLEEFSILVALIDKSVDVYLDQIN